jgi:hypothetical protein
MYLAYFDESGDSGHPAVVATPTRFFVLSGVILHQDNWMPTLNRLIDIRRILRDQYNIPARPEIKGQHIRPGRGVFRGLPMTQAQRLTLYRELMQFQEARLDGLRCFCIAINKGKIIRRDMDIREVAWTYALQRIDRFCEENNDKAIIFPDEGHGMFIRRILRRIRRHQQISGYFGGVRNIPAERIVEDPNDRQSHDSYLIQLADWNALACHRSQYIDPRPQMPTDLWDLIPRRHLAEVNELTGGPPGIVVWPR